MAKKDKKNDKKGNSSIKVSDKLKEFDIEINSFGEIISNYDIDKINDFLNKNVEDKKLLNREDKLYDELKSKETDSSEEAPNEETKE